MLQTNRHIEVHPVLKLTKLDSILILLVLKVHNLSLSDTLVVLLLLDIPLANFDLNILLNDIVNFFMELVTKNLAVVT